MSGFWELLVLDLGPSGPGASWARGVVGGYHFYNVQPDVVSRDRMRFETRSAEVLAHRLRLGKCRLDSCLHKIALHDTSTCDSCGEAEAIEHYLINCSQNEIAAAVTAAVISQQLPGMLCIKRKQEIVLCRGLVTDKMADCIAQLHCMTGCDANSGFYGKGKKTVYDRAVKSPEAQQHLLRCEDSLDLQEDVLEKLFQFTRQIIYCDKKVEPWQRPVQ